MCFGMCSSFAAESERRPIDFATARTTATMRIGLSTVAVLVCFVAEDGQLVGPIPCDVSLTVTANDVAAAANDAVEPHSSGHAAIFCPLTPNSSELQYSMCQLIRPNERWIVLRL